MTAPQNPMDQILAARAALAQRSIALFWIPNDERLEISKANDAGMFEDVAAIGLVTLTYGEQSAVMRRMGDKTAIDAGNALLAEAVRAVVVGGPILVPSADADGSMVLADETANPTAPIKLASSTDALRYITRLHPIAHQRALLAYAELHTAKEDNNKRFLASKTHIAG